MFEPLLPENISWVSACYPYRGQRLGESPRDYVTRLAQELEDEFQCVGPETICAFIVEPMAGTVSLPPLTPLPDDYSLF